MKTQGFFSRDNDEALDFLEELSRKGIFFIEEIATQRWIEGNNQGNFNGDWKTNDPNKAMRFESRFDAMTYMTKNQLKHTDWYITEHEFVDKPSIATEDNKAPVLEELPEPIGNFIFANANGKMMPDGAYYHYSDVCNLLMRYASQERNRAIQECIPLIERCEQTFGKIDQIFTTLLEAQPADLYLLIRAIDIELPLIQAKIKDELSKLKK